jgi:TrkA-C domain
MIAVVALVAAIAISLLITRVGAMALTLTGLSRELARFQARSAFTGVGFTTTESEQVVNHPVRRQIVMLLMLLGNAGIITVVATFVITFAQSGGADAWLMRSAVIAGAFVALWFLSWNRFVDRGLSRVIAWGLKKWTRLEARDYAHLLHLSGNYSVAELAIGPRDWLAGKTLAEAQLRQEGVLVLGVQRRDRTYLGAPNGGTKVVTGDTLIVYGPGEAVEELDKRRATGAGQRAHERAERRQQRAADEERAQDPVA